MELGDVEHPRVVVAVGTSVDSRVTLSSDRLLLDEATRRVWDSLQPQTMRAVADARGAQIERAYQPQAVLEGSGTFVTSAAGPLIGLPKLPAAGAHPLSRRREGAGRPGRRAAPDGQPAGRHVRRLAGWWRPERRPASGRAHRRAPPACLPRTDRREGHADARRRPRARGQRIADTATSRLRPRPDRRHPLAAL